MVGESSAVRVVLPKEPQTGSLTGPQAAPQQAQPTKPTRRYSDTRVPERRRSCSLGSILRFVPLALTFGATADAKREPYRAVMFESPDRGYPRHMREAMQNEGVSARIAEVPEHAVYRYPFPRNLALKGPHGMLMSLPENMGRVNMHMAFGADQLRTHFVNNGVDVAILEKMFVNWAGLHWDPRRDALVMRLGRSDWPCDLAMQPVAGCDKEIAHIEFILGNPAHVVKFEPAVIEVPRRIGMVDFCFDLDLIWGPLDDADGKPLGLVFPDCMAETPSAPGAEAAGVVGRDEALRQLEALGYRLVPISRSDFERRAANVLNPAPGVAIFAGRVSDELKERLRALNVNVSDSRNFGTDRDFGPHCLTLEVPAPNGQGKGRMFLIPADAAGRDWSFVYGGAGLTAAVALGIAALACRKRGDAAASAASDASNEADAAPAAGIVRGASPQAAQTATTHARHSRTDSSPHPLSLQPEPGAGRAERRRQEPRAR